MIMLFGEKEDWKGMLTDDAQEVLSRIFDMAKKHKAAYIQSDDVKIAQLWSALIELKKDIDSVKEALGKVEEPWRAVISIGEAAKKQTIERLVSEIIRPTDTESQEATKKLVESLMKF